MWREVESERVIIVEEAEGLTSDLEVTGLFRQRYLAKGKSRLNYNMLEHAIAAGNGS
jgi:hypothetical protein